MNSDNPVRTIRYLGGKRRLADEIVGTLTEAARRGTVAVDLFSGSSAISLQLASKYTVFSNDSQQYARVLFKGLLGNPRWCDTSTNIWQALKPHFDENRILLSKAFAEGISAELNFTRSVDIDQEKYQDFVNTLPYIETVVANNYSSGYNSQFDLNRSVVNLDGKLVSAYSLFTKYFAGAYFGVNQCVEIDSIRYAIARQDAYPKDALLAGLIYSCSELVSAPGHFAQYLKPRGSSIASRLVATRNISVVQAFKSHIDRMYSVPRSRKIGHRAVGDDVEQALDNVSNEVGARQIAIVYADPPYTADHYSRFYHVLETLVEYDYPGATGKGRYRSNRFVSAFSIKTKNTAAWRELISKVALLGAPAVFSYSNSGLISVGQLISLCKASFRKVYVKEIPIQHSSQGRGSSGSNGSVPPMVQRREILVICRQPIR